MSNCTVPLVHGKCPPKEDTFFAFGYSGIITMAAVLGVIGTYALFVWVKRIKSRQKKMSDIHAGGFRFAAAQGNVPALNHIKDNAPFFDVNIALHGWTALHAAAIQGHAHVITWLVENGADVTAIKEDDWKDTVLHYAAANGHSECVEVLLSVGANPTETNFEGATPADLARKGGYGDLAKVLIEAAADWVRRDSFRMIALQMKEEAEVHNDGLGSSFRREVAQLDRLLAETEDPPEGLGKIDESDSSRSGQPSASVSGGSSPDSKHSSVASPQKNELEMSSLAREYRLDAKPVMSVRVKTGSDAKPRTVKPGSDPTDKDVPEESWITANRKEPEGWSSMRKDQTAEDARAFAELMNRGWEGLGTEGTRLRDGWPLFRVSAVVCQTLGVIYIVWRACRTYNIEALWLSIPFYMAELVSFLPSFIFCLEVWCPSYREPRHLNEMEGLSPDEFPSVDIIIVCYSEPVDIVEATACAALNLNYPADKLTVYICDDGKKDEMRAMAHRVEFQRRYLKRQAPLVYVSRTKVKGVPHHAKAGNINNLLLKGGARGDFVVVFDCDMIPKPDFLMRTIPHFFRTRPGGRGWEQKNRVGFLQTPQDFYNLEGKDPYGNRARFFYGPMMQGRDGVGSCPCVGTGVIFRREALISMGGQAYGSITEDYNTAMGLLGGGFSSMFLNELLIFGIAPDDIMTVLTQRQRWAMGSLQILCLDNPLTKGGLTIPQSLLFYQSCIQYTLSLPTLLMAIVPILFMFSGISPIHAKVHEFLVFFVGYYLANRIMLFLAHRGVPNAGMEMWRGSQQWVWLVPNNLVACWKAFSTELAFFKLFKLGKLGFTVTNKDGNDDWRKALRVTWPFFLYYIGIVGGVMYTIVFIGVGTFNVEEAASRVVAFAWGFLVCMYILPPIIGVFPWLAGKDKPGGVVKWEADTALAAPPKTPRPKPFARPSLKRLLSKEKYDGPAVTGEATAETAASQAPSTGRNGLMMTRQQVIPIEERELNILYQLVLKNEARTTSPFLRAQSQSPAVTGSMPTHVTMPSIELPPAAVTEEEEGRENLPKGPEEPRQTFPGSDKMVQFKAKRGISLTALPDQGDDNRGLDFEASPRDVKIDIEGISPSPIEDREDALARNTLGALLTSRGARAQPSLPSKTPLAKALDSLALVAPTPRARAEAELRAAASPASPASARAGEHFYSLGTPRARPLSAASTPSARASPTARVHENPVFCPISPLDQGRKEQEWPIEDKKEGFAEFKEKMTTRAVYFDHASLEARPVFELKGSKKAGGEGMRPHLTFIITNSVLLAGFIAGGLVYVFKLSLDNSWLGIH